MTLASPAARGTRSPLRGLREAAPATWRVGAVLSVAVWCAVGAFVARACVPRSLDLRVYRDAALLAVHGGAVYERSFTPQHFPFTYPPFALLFFTPLTLLDEVPAIWAFDALGAACLVGALTLCVRHVWRWPRRRSVVLAALLAGTSCLLLEPVRSTLLDGQVNLLLLAGIVADLLVVPRRARGVLIGLAAAIKLTPLVFVGYLVLNGERRAAMRAVVAFAAATGLAWLLHPRDSATFWLHQAFSPGRRGAARTAYNQSWWGLVGRLPAAESARLAVWLALCAATVVLGAFVARRALRGRRHLDVILAVAVVGLLVSPISWTHHWCWVALIPVALVAPAPRRRAVVVGLAILLATAVAAPYGWHLTGPGSVVAGFALVGAGALLLGCMAVAERAAGRAPGGAAPPAVPSGATAPR